MVAELNNLVEFLLILGLVLLAIEILVLGFSTFVMFFVGLAAVLTAGLIYLDMVPNNILGALLSVGVLTAVSAAVLWRPLKGMQSDVDVEPVQSDLIGMSFVLTDDVSEDSSSTYRYSGIDWKLISHKPIKSGTEVTVVKADVGEFTIEEK